MLRLSPSHAVYRQTSNIRRTLVGNEIVDHSDVAGASAPTTFHSRLTLDFNELVKGNCKTRRETFKFWDLLGLILEV